MNQPLPSAGPGSLRLVPGLSMDLEQQAQFQESVAQTRYPWGLAPEAQGGAEPVSTNPSYVAPTLELGRGDAPPPQPDFNAPQRITVSVAGTVLGAVGLGVVVLTILGVGVYVATRS